jgi:hypothetical protein
MATALSSTAGAETRPLTTSASAAGSAAAVTPSATKTCFTNLKTPGDSIINSQNFEAGFEAYDNAGADDFKLKAACTVSKITVPGGYYTGSPGPADSETVTIYKNKKGKPGKVVNKQTVKGTDNAGTFTIPLKKVALDKGTYWVSVVANMDVSTGGQWGWLTSTTKKGNAALWQNPGDGFASGCVKWTDMQTCTGLTGQPDFSFELGKAAK